MIRRALITFAALTIILSSVGGLRAQRKVPPKTVDPTTSLSDTKQIRIKAFVKHLERMGKEAGPPTKTEDIFTVGMTVPSSVVLFALPEDAVTDVPQVTSYRFFVAQNEIIVVDLSTRGVVQVIR